jgi:hypothetical protein
VEKQQAAREQFLQNHSQWREALTVRRVEQGMNLDALRWLRRSPPFGEKKFVSHLWCDNVHVDECSDQCERCQGIAQMGAWLYLLDGKGREPLVSHSALDFVGLHRLDLDDLDYTAAAAMVQEQIQPGMPLEALEMLPTWNYYPKTFYCGNKKLKKACKDDCATCTIEITPKGSERLNNTRIVLQPHNSQLKVTSVQTTQSNSTPKITE